MRRDVTRQTFRGPELAVVGARARRALGEDAVILGTRVIRERGEVVVEAIAATAEDVERFVRRMTPGSVERRASSVDGAPLDARRSTLDASPRVIALVGPTGAGKTTSAVKLALNEHAFGSHRVGLVTLDTYRAGAVAQLETYAEVARLPMEVVYDAADVPGALARLARCDVVIVDTPGRGPRTSDDDAPWRALLASLAPDEVHLVIPATMRTELAERLRDRLDALLGAAGGDGARGVTHALLTKLDEVPDDDGVATLAAQLDLPVRWIAEGQEIPVDLAPGAPRLLAALGRFPDSMTDVISVTLDRPAEGSRRRDGATGARATA
jgi:flagellar biosynthesis protein FlhF